jgi:hypothetical protein
MKSLLLFQRRGCRVSMAVIPHLMTTLVLHWLQLAFITQNIPHPPFPVVCLVSYLYPRCGARSVHLSLGVENIYTDQFFADENTATIMPDH